MYTSFYKLLMKLNLEEEIAALKKKKSIFQSRDQQCSPLIDLFYHPPSKEDNLENVCFSLKITVYIKKKKF